MSLSQRLKGLQMKSEPNPSDVAHLSIQDLENEMVDFGKKNCGRSYMEVWNTDQEWVAFMADRYSKSHNPTGSSFDSWNSWFNITRSNRCLWWSRRT